MSNEIKPKIKMMYVLILSIFVVLRKSNKKTKKNVGSSKRLSPEFAPTMKRI